MPLSSKTAAEVVVGKKENGEDVDVCLNWTPSSADHPGDSRSVSRGWFTASILDDSWTTWVIHGAYVG